MTPLNNSVHPMEEPTSPPAKKRGCCGRLGIPGCCSKMSTRVGAVCGKLACHKRTKPLAPRPPKPEGPQRSRLREMAARLNCLRWCRRRPRPPQEVEVANQEDETSVRCCQGCGIHLHRVHRYRYSIGRGKRAQAALEVF